MDKQTLQAAEWMLELQDRDLSEDRLAAWQRWLSEDVGHRQAFDRLQKVQESIDALHSLPWPSDKEVEEDIDASQRFSANEAPNEMDRTPLVVELPRSGLRRPVALAAGIAVLSVGVSALVYLNRDTWLVNADTKLIETSIGELRRVPLADGSILTAGGHSRIAVHFAETSRDIQLKRGEAFFEVAKDPARPFIVRAGEAVIQAIGTAFNVRRTGEHITVAVTEGAVQTTGGTGTLRISAGQQIRLGPQLKSKPIAVTSAAVTAWRDGQRQYRAEPLADVLADLARYSTRTVVIEDERIGQLTITGTVFEREIDKWLASLGSALPVQVHTAADGTVRIAAAPQTRDSPGSAGFSSD